jgi:hypothetical protein
MGSLAYQTGLKRQTQLANELTSTTRIRIEMICG